MLDDPFSRGDDPFSQGRGSGGGQGGGSGSGLTVIGILLVALGLFFFITVSCVQSFWDGRTYCDFGDPSTWTYAGGGLGFMSWLRVVLLAAGGLFVVLGALQKSSAKKQDEG